MRPSDRAPPAGPSRERRPSIREGGWNRFRDERADFREEPSETKGVARTKKNLKPNVTVKCDSKVNNFKREIQLVCTVSDTVRLDFRRRTHLAPFAGMDAVVEAGGLVAADATENGGTVEF